LTVTGAVLPGRPFRVTDAGGGLEWMVATHLTRAPILVPSAKRVTRPAILVPPAATPGFVGDDAALIALATAHPQTGLTLARLPAGETLDHPSPSEADEELAHLLGFWAGGDAERVERLMRMSGAALNK
jgi:hypothetical protein